MLVTMVNLEVSTDRHHYQNNSSCLKQKIVRRNISAIILWLPLSMPVFIKTIVTRRRSEYPSIYLVIDIYKLNKFMFVIYALQVTGGN